MRDTAVRSLRRRFEAQTQTFLPALYGAARRLMSGPAEAEAVVTEVYGRAYRTFQEPTDRGLLKRWLFELWWQVCLDTWRRQHQHGRPQPRPSPPPIRAALTPLPAATIDLSANDARTIVHRAIENLPIALRVVVILVDIEGFSYQEAAAIVGCSVDLVAARLHRARRRLCDQLRNDLKPAASNP
jgi:RNA polymerase sigma-70 factor (ECF subfamily)